MVTAKVYEKPLNHLLWIGCENVYIKQLKTMEIFMKNFALEGTENEFRRTVVNNTIKKVEHHDVSNMHFL
jgi:hypothetical protein